MNEDMEPAEGHKLPFYVGQNVMDFLSYTQKQTQDTILESIYVARPLILEMFCSRRVGTFKGVPGRRHFQVAFPVSASTAMISTSPKPVTPCGNSSSNNARRRFLGVDYVHFVLVLWMGGLELPQPSRVLFVSSALVGGRRHRSLRIERGR